MSSPVSFRPPPNTGAAARTGGTANTGTPAVSSTNVSNTLRQQRLSDAFEARATPNYAALLGNVALNTPAQAAAPPQADAAAETGGTDGTGETAQADAAAPTGGTTTSPEVQSAADDINNLPPEEQAMALERELAAHSSDSPEDVAYRQELLNTLGADRVGQILGSQDEWADPSTTMNILAAAAETYSPEDQGKVLEGAGSERVSRALASDLDAAGDPVNTARSDAARARLESVSRMIGNAHALPPGAPGRDAAVGALERLRTGQEEYLGQMPGSSAAAWIVSHSGNDQLRMDFANRYIEEYKADPSSLSPEEARAVAWALGSVENPELQDDAMKPLVGMSPEQRVGFLNKMTEAEYLETPEFETGQRFQQDMLAGVNEFLMDVSRINPSQFDDPQQATDFRVETFREVTEAVDGHLFSRDQAGGVHQALANIFASDTATIVDKLANQDPNNPYADWEGRILSKFFDHVAFRNEQSREVVVGALKNYFFGSEADPGDGIIEKLVNSKGDPNFMANEGGNLLARNLGFVLGALYQGADSAMSHLDSEHAKKKAVVDIFGGILETAIQKNPEVAAAYGMIKDGTGGRASVDTVFNWLADTFLGEAGSTDVQGVLNGLLEEIMRPFLGNQALQGAYPQDYNAIFQFINLGFGAGDGSHDPTLNIGGAPPRND